jgi:hypothetical protein
VDLDCRRRVHAHDLIAVEVGLLDPAVLQRDLAIERRSMAALSTCARTVSGLTTGVRALTWMVKAMASSRVRAD